MRDIDLLSDEYSLLQNCFDQLKNDPPPSVSDFRKALQDLAEAAHGLKEMTAVVAARYEQAYGCATPHLRLVEKDIDDSGGADFSAIRGREH
ncbi:hypothetical protein [Pseudomonas mandelii]|uniref:hypothetical protein n=1 Tax=Pseudomonas mandelii TaxID=75612 RepID=UPI00224B4ED7|nr:hypothetical protein [Pseudomonas mandelii]MCX2901090.1 hypothetical protein [Pseudomonas mandelii]